MSLFDRISLLVLFKKHRDTFYDDAILRLHGRRVVPRTDKFIFIIFPLILSAGFVLLGLFMSDDYLNVVLTCLSIFTGLLFGLLPLVFDLTKKLGGEYSELNRDTSGTEIRTEVSEAATRYRISKEVFINISFSILLCITAIITSTLTRFSPKGIDKVIQDPNLYCILKSSFIYGMNFINYYVIILFFLTALMVLKRFFLLFLAENRE